MKPVVKFGEQADMVELRDSTEQIDSISIPEEQR